MSYRHTINLIAIIKHYNHVRTPYTWRLAIAVLSSISGHKSKTLLTVTRRLRQKTPELILARAFKNVYISPLSVH